MPTYSNVLTINRDRYKGIPYGGVGQTRDDGDANYGFRYAKGNDELLQQIPELQRDESLYLLASLINAAETGLFTVGCVSGPIQDEKGHRDSGYMEFTINSKSSIADPGNYFQIFFHFDAALAENKFPVAVSYLWELQPATFFECDHAAGFTCSITINTHYCTSRQEADQAWSDALDALGYYLASVPPLNNDFLYPQ